MKEIDFKELAQDYLKVYRLLKGKKCNLIWKVCRLASPKSVKQQAGRLEIQVRVDIANNLQIDIASLKFTGQASSLGSEAGFLLHKVCVCFLSL